MSEIIKIVAKEKYGESCFSDKMNTAQGQNRKERKPKGYVEIYDVSDGEKKLVGKENLVVYLGREWLMERAFNLQNTSILPEPIEFITWFGLGDGGCLTPDPLDPIPPTNLDTELNNKIPINLTNTSYADFVYGEGYYKMPFDSVVYEQDSENDGAWLIARVTTTVGILDANGYTLSEAGLYTASSNVGGYTGPFHLYAKVTFPSIVKTSSRHLIFIWYVYY